MGVGSRLETRQEIEIRPQRPSQMGFERGGGGFGVSVQQGVIDLSVLGEHLQQFRGALIGLERRMNYDDDELAAHDRLEQCCVGTMRQSIVMKIALDSLEFAGLDPTGAGLDALCRADA